MRRGLAPVVIGEIGAVGASRLLESMLFGISAADPWVLALAPMALTAVAVAALWPPVLRASRVDPLVILRAD